jgi:hypothetical protein
MTINALQTAVEYSKLYEERRVKAKVPYSKFHGFAYDGIWVIARAVDSLIRKNNGEFNLEDFRTERLRATLNETDFIGVTVCYSLILLASVFTVAPHYLFAGPRGLQQWRPHRWHRCPPVSR